MIFGPFSEYRYALSSSRTLVLLVVAKGSIGEAFFRQIESFAVKAALRMPVKIGIAGLGRLLDVREFVALGAGSAERRARGKVLAPVIAALDGGPISPVLVRESEDTPLPFDMEDFQPFLASYGFLLTLVDKLFDISVEKMLGAPVEWIDVYAERGVPVEWDGGDWALDLDSLALSTASQTPKPLRAIFAAPTGTTVTVKIHRTDGSTEQVSGQTTPASISSCWSVVSQQDGLIFDAWIAGRECQCPKCPGRHRIGEAVCTAGGQLLGELILDSLTDAAVGRGALVLHVSPGEKEVLYLGHGVVPVSENEALVRAKGRVLRLLRTDELTWRPATDSGFTFAPVGGDAYALFA